MTKRYRRFTLSTLVLLVIGSGVVFAIARLQDAAEMTKLSLSVGTLAGCIGIAWSVKRITTAFGVESTGSLVAAAICTIGLGVYAVLSILLTFTHPGMAGFTALLLVVVMVLIVWMISRT